MDFLDFRISRKQDIREEFIFISLLWGVVFAVLLSRHNANISGITFIISYVPIAILSSFVSIGLWYILFLKFNNYYGFRGKMRPSLLSILISLITSIFGFILMLPCFFLYDTNTPQLIKRNISLSMVFTQIILGTLSLTLSLLPLIPVHIFFESFGLMNLLGSFAGIILFPVGPVFGREIIKWSVPWYLLILAFNVILLIGIGRSVF